MISIKGGKSGVKGQSGTTADTKFKPPSVTDYDEGDGADGDGDATSRGGDATSQHDLEEKSVHERRRFGREKMAKKVEEEEQKKGKSRKNTFDVDALDKLAEFERQEKIANGELPPDEEILIHPDEDILFD